MADLPTHPAAPTTLVVHAGALGDSILLWPLLRALVRRGKRVFFAANPSHARLAAEELGVLPLDIDRLAPLWLPPPQTLSIHDPHPNLPFLSATSVMSFLADPHTPSGRSWLANAKLAFPAATIVPIGPPGSPSRQSLWERLDAPTLGAAPARHNPSGPIVLHIGAGSRAKRWPLDRWQALAATLAADQPTIPIRVLAGHVEHEQFSPDERARFDALHGRYLLDDLPALAAELRAARLFIGADSGPTHLAAQLGVPTVALFGPTDPAVWKPVGPRVTVVAPQQPTADMAWLSLPEASAAVR